MEQKKFCFQEAAPLIQFIEQNRDKIIGHTLQALYINGYFYTHEDTCNILFLVFDNICIGVEYYIKSDISIIIADSKDFIISDGYANEEEKTKHVTFINQLSGEETYLTWFTDIPAMGQKVADIFVHRTDASFHSSENDFHPKGGDYFDAIQLVLEDGTRLYICGAEDPYYDMHVFMKDIDLREVENHINRTPYEIYRKIHNKIPDAVNASRDDPDRLAEIAMRYMRKCDHEIEKHKENNDTPFRSRFYTDLLHDILNLFVNKGMNIEYIDDSGKSLLQLALEIGDTASNCALAPLYESTKNRWQLERVFRSIKGELEFLSGLQKDMKKEYDVLPQCVKDTKYGQRLLEFTSRDFQDLKKTFDDLRNKYNLIM